MFPYQSTMSFPWTRLTCHPNLNQSSKTHISQVWYATLVNDVWSASSMRIQKVWTFLSFNLEDLPVQPIHLKKKSGILYLA